MISTSRAGKVRGMKLPLEYDLAKFISEIENPYPSWSTATPACEWDGVKCNNKGDVTEINWSSRQLRGVLHWEHLPQSLILLNIHNNQLCGNVDFSALPRGLQRMWIGENLFSGELHFKDLPPTVTVLNASSCRFSGHVDFLSIQHSSLAKTASGFDLLNNPALKGTVSRNVIPQDAYWGIPDSWIKE